MTAGRRDADIRTWLTNPMSSDMKRAIDRLARLDDVTTIAVMPDAHLAHDVCIGTVTATTRTLLPQAVGSDIGCGMAAIAFDATSEVLAEEPVARSLLEGLATSVPIRKHAAATIPRGGNPAECVRTLSDPRLDTIRRRDGRVQLGTLGRGNHFLELQADVVDDRLWLMVHSGSRAIGSAVHRHHLERGERQSGGLVTLDAESDRGRAYLADAEWAIAYADASRRAMVEAASRLLFERTGIRSDPSTLRTCHHNHVARERYGDSWLWVHRKGAIAASSGEVGIIPGSMGSMSYHVVGRGVDAALRSSSHGAGRAMSREQARRRISGRELVGEMRGVWFDESKASALRDEAPSAYRNIGAVMRAQRKLTRIERRLRPLLSYKGV